MDERAYHAALLEHHAEYRKEASASAAAVARIEALKAAASKAEKQRQKVADLEAQANEMKANKDPEFGGFVENELGPARDVLGEYEELAEQANSEPAGKATPAMAMDAVPGDIKAPSGSSVDPRRKSAEASYLGKLIVFDKPPLKQELDELPGGRPTDGSYALQSSFEGEVRVITAIMRVMDKPEEWKEERTNLFTDQGEVCRGVSFG